MKIMFCRNKLFSIGMIIFLMLFVSACTKSNDTPAGGYSISGIVTGGGGAGPNSESGIAGAEPGLPGVTMTLGGDGTGTTTTGADGSYSFTGLGNGTYTVTPSLTGMVFSDVSTVKIVNGASVPDTNFEAIAGSGYIISGRVTLDPCLVPAGKASPSIACISGKSSGAPAGTLTGLAGVLVTLADNGTGTTVTDVNGNYSFPGVVAGSYTVTPSKSGYTFIDPSLSVTLPDETIPDNNGNSLGNDFLATPNFTQADLYGTWDMQLLRTGSQNAWVRARVQVGISGIASCVSYSDSTPATGCPDPFALTFTMNSATGVITQSGDNAADAGNHMTMTPNKNFMAGTGTTSSSYHLSIAQRVPFWAVEEAPLAGPATMSYSNTDLASKTFVFHGLSVGGVNGWAYGSGTTNESRVINFAVPTLSDEDVVTLPSGLVVSVDSDGIVTIATPPPPPGPCTICGAGPMLVSGIPSFQGFLSDDKKTIVGTFTTDDSYQLIIIQITGVYAPAAMTWSYLPAGVSAAHMLAAGPAPFWAHSTLTVGELGAITLSDWSASNGMAKPDTTGVSGKIWSDGHITRDGDSTYHGQMSSDGYFTIGTATLDTGVYSLIVTTSTVPATPY